MKGLSNDSLEKVPLGFLPCRCRDSDGNGGDCGKNFRIFSGFEEMDFQRIKRKELQALCRKHHMPANLTNSEMAKNLASLLKGTEKPMVRGRSCLKDINETLSENGSDGVIRPSKKVRFSPENETIEFVGSSASWRKFITKPTEQKETLVVNSVDNIDTSREIRENQFRTTRSRAQKLLSGEVTDVVLPVAEKKRKMANTPISGSVKKNDGKRGGGTDSNSDLSDHLVSESADAEETGLHTRRSLRSREVLISKNTEEVEKGRITSKKNQTRLRNKRVERNVEISKETDLGEERKIIQHDKASESKRDVREVHDCGPLRSVSVENEVTRRDKRAHSKIPLVPSESADAEEIGVQARRSLRNREVLISNKSEEVQDDRIALKKNQLSLRKKDVERNVEISKDTGLGEEHKIILHDKSLRQSKLSVREVDDCGPVTSVSVENEVTGRDRKARSKILLVASENADAEEIGVQTRRSLRNREVPISKKSEEVENDRIALKKSQSSSRNKDMERNVEVSKDTGLGEEGEIIQHDKALRQSKLNVKEVENCGLKNEVIGRGGRALLVSESADAEEIGVQVRRSLRNREVPISKNRAEAEKNGIVFKKNQTGLKNKDVERNDEISEDADLGGECKITQHDKALRQSKRSVREVDDCGPLRRISVQNELTETGLKAHSKIFSVDNASPSESDTGTKTKVVQHEEPTRCRGKNGVRRKSVLPQIEEVQNDGCEIEIEGRKQLRKSVLEGGTRGKKLEGNDTRPKRRTKNSVAVSDGRDWNGNHGGNSEHKRIRETFLEETVVPEGVTLGEEPPPTLLTGNAAKTAPAVKSKKHGGKSKQPNLEQLEPLAERTLVFKKPLILDAKLVTQEIAERTVQSSRKHQSNSSPEDMNEFSEKCVFKEVPVETSAVKEARPPYLANLVKIGASKSLKLSTDHVEIEPMVSVSSSVVDEENSLQDDSRCLNLDDLGADSCKRSKELESKLFVESEEDLNVNMDAGFPQTTIGVDGYLLVAERDCTASHSDMFDTWNEMEREEPAAPECKDPRSIVAYHGVDDDKSSAVKEQYLLERKVSASVGEAIGSESVADVHSAESKETDSTSVVDLSNGERFRTTNVQDLDTVEAEKSAVGAAGQEPLIGNLRTQNLEMEPVLTHSISAFRSLSVTYPRLSELEVADGTINPPLSIGDKFSEYTNVSGHRPGRNSHLNKQHDLIEVCTENVDSDDKRAPMMLNIKDSSEQEVDIPASESLVVSEKENILLVAGNQKFFQDDLQHGNDYDLVSQTQTHYGNFEDQNNIPTVDVKEKETTFGAVDFSPPNQAERAAKSYCMLTSSVHIEMENSASGKYTKSSGVIKADYAADDGKYPVLKVQNIIEFEEDSNFSKQKKQEGVCGGYSTGPHGSESTREECEIATKNASNIGTATPLPRERISSNTVEPNNNKAECVKHVSSSSFETAKVDPESDFENTSIYCIPLNSPESEASPIGDQEIQFTRSALTIAGGVRASPIGDQEMQFTIPALTTADGAQGNANLLEIEEKSKHDNQFHLGIMIDSKTSKSFTRDKMCRQENSEPFADNESEVSLCVESASHPVEESDYECLEESSSIERHTVSSLNMLNDQPTVENENADSETNSIHHYEKVAETRANILMNERRILLPVERDIHQTQDTLAPILPIESSLHVNNIFISSSERTPLKDDNETGYGFNTLFASPDNNASPSDEAASSHQTEMVYPRIQDGLPICTVKNRRLNHVGLENFIGLRENKNETAVYEMNVSPIVSKKASVEGSDANDVHVGDKGCDGSRYSGNDSKEDISIEVLPHIIGFLLELEAAEGTSNPTSSIREIFSKYTNVQGQGSGRNPSLKTQHDLIEACTESVDFDEEKDRMMVNLQENTPASNSVNFQCASTEQEVHILASEYLVVTEKERNMSTFQLDMQHVTKYDLVSEIQTNHENFEVINNSPGVDAEEITFGALGFLPTVQAEHVAKPYCNLTLGGHFEMEKPVSGKYAQSDGFTEADFAAEDGKYPLHEDISFSKQSTPEGVHQVYSTGPDGSESTLEYCELALKNASILKTPATSHKLMTSSNTVERNNNKAEFGKNISSCNLETGKEVLEERTGFQNTSSSCIPDNFLECEASPTGDEENQFTKPALTIADGPQGYVDLIEVEEKKKNDNLFQLGIMTDSNSFKSYKGDQMSSQEKSEALAVYETMSEGLLCVESASDPVDEETDYERLEGSSSFERHTVSNLNVLNDQPTEENENADFEANSIPYYQKIAETSMHVLPNENRMLIPVERNTDQTRDTLAPILPLDSSLHVDNIFISSLERTPVKDDNETGYELNTLFASPANNASPGDEAVSSHQTEMCYPIIQEGLNKDETMLHERNVSPAVSIKVNGEGSDASESTEVAEVDSGSYSALDSFTSNDGHVGDKGSNCSRYSGNVSKEDRSKDVVPHIVGAGIDPIMFDSESDRNEYSKEACDRHESMTTFQAMGAETDRECSDDATPCTTPCDLENKAFGTSAKELSVRELRFSGAYEVQYEGMRSSPIDFLRQTNNNDTSIKGDLHLECSKLATKEKNEENSPHVAVWDSKGCNDLVEINSRSYVGLVETPCKESGVLDVKIVTEFIKSPSKSISQTKVLKEREIESVLAPFDHLGHSKVVFDEGGEFLTEDAGGVDDSGGIQNHDEINPKNSNVDRDEVVARFEKNTSDALEKLANRKEDVDLIEVSKEVAGTQFQIDVRFHDFTSPGMPFTCEQEKGSRFNPSEPVSAYSQHGECNASAEVAGTKLQFKEMRLDSAASSRDCSIMEGDFDLSELNVSDSVGQVSEPHVLQRELGSDVERKDATEIDKVDLFDDFSFTVSSLVPINCSEDIGNTPGTMYKSFVEHKDEGMNKKDREMSDSISTCATDESNVEENVKFEENLSYIEDTIAAYQGTMGSGDSDLSLESTIFKGISAEESQTMEPRSELVKGNSEVNLLNSSTTIRRKNAETSWIQGTPLKKLTPAVDMKENERSIKRENLSGSRSVRTLTKRRALDDLPNH